MRFTPLLAAEPSPGHCLNNRNSRPPESGRDVAVVCRAAGKRPFLSAFFGPLICWIGRPGKPRVPRSPPNSNKRMAARGYRSRVRGAGRGEGRPNSGKRDVTRRERCFSLPASPNPRAFLNFMYVARIFAVIAPSIKRSLRGEAKFPR